MSGVFTLYGNRVGFRHIDTFVHLGVGFTNRTITVLFSHAAFCIVNRFCSCFTSESGNVAGFVADVGDVYVDQAQTDFLQFGFYVTADFFQKLVAVSIDFLNIHGCDDQTELTKDNIFCQVLDFAEFETE